ncbi:MAG: hypothetical protein JW818_16565 [Pirellulales bacterium]|nr:hypothetical protein [Pirellulales bacterium]
MRCASVLIGLSLLVVAAMGCESKPPTPEEAKSQFLTAVKHDFSGEGADWGDAAKVCFREGNLVRNFQDVFDSAHMKDRLRPDPRVFRGAHTRYIWQLSNESEGVILCVYVGNDPPEVLEMRLDAIVH